MIHFVITIFLKIIIQNQIKILEINKNKESRMCLYIFITSFAPWQTYNDYLECHNLNFKNIGELRVIKGEQDILKKCKIIFILSKNGMLGLGTELLRLAHNFSNVGRRLVTPMDDENVISY